jgi:hypothetical protein
MDGGHILLLMGAGLVFVLVMIWTGGLSPEAHQAVKAMEPELGKLEAEVSSLRRKTETQQQTIHALERRVAELEKRLPPAP